MSILEVVKMQSSNRFFSAIISYFYFHIVLFAYFLSLPYEKLTFQRRTTPITGTKSFGVRILSLVSGLILLAVFFYLIGVDALNLYMDLIIVNIRLFPSTLGIFIPLCCIAVGLAIPFKARIDNIGAEGQYIMGTLGAVGTAFAFPYLPFFLLIPLMFIVGFILGAIWAIPVVIFRTKGGFQGSDVVVSFLLVFPALYIMEFLVSGPWRDPETGFTYSSRVPEAGQIPKLDFTLNLPFEIDGIPVNWDFSPIHITIFLVLLIAILAYYFLFKQVKGVSKTKIGYEINVSGKNRLAGKTAGISFFKVALITMVLSGGLAGIAGVGEIAGNQLRLTPISPGYGFTAIAVAYLGGLNPIGIIISAFFFAALFIGGNAIKLTQGLPGTSLQLFSGTILIFVLVAEFFLRYKLILRSSRRSE
ncbi:MAG: ABC transporter permease [Candidatus Hodarchaeales archaeon]|jgi:simple sugar transport system permease protein